jgi:hypothetical protein
MMGETAVPGVDSVASRLCGALVALAGEVLGVVEGQAEGGTGGCKVD